MPIKQQKDSSFTSVFNYKLNTFYHSIYIISPIFQFVNQKRNFFPTSCFLFIFVIIYITSGITSYFVYFVKQNKFNNYKLKSNIIPLRYHDEVCKIVFFNRKLFFKIRPVFFHHLYSQHIYFCKQSIYYCNS